MTDEQIKHMTDRFLSWHLPRDFAPDAGISFDGARLTAHPELGMPTGTNLFDANQAEQMVRHMVEGLGMTDTADRLFEATKHGDEKHQAWLQSALRAFFSGADVPKVPPIAPTDTEKDAARYRWLRKQGMGASVVPGLGECALRSLSWVESSPSVNHTTIDEAIDLEIARSEAAKGEKGK
jgi:hypothetical protein